MAVLDPMKRAKAFVVANPLGAIVGGITGILLVRKYSPNKGWIVMTVAVLGGVISGAYVQGKLKAFSGSKKSETQTKPNQTKPNQTVTDTWFGLPR
jgi:hypothetical protein